VGSVRHIDWATRLPCRIQMEVEAVEPVRLERLQARSRGQLDAKGL
jgi:hypothetical protein